MATHLPGRFGGPVATGVVGLAATLLLLSANWSKADQSNKWGYHDAWVANLEQLEPNSILVTHVDMSLGVSTYLQVAEGKAPGVTVLCPLLLVDDWYLDGKGDQELRTVGRATWEQVARQFADINDSRSRDYQNAVALFAAGLAEHYRGRRTVYSPSFPVGIPMDPLPRYVGLRDVLYRLDFWPSEPQASSVARVAAPGRAGRGQAGRAKPEGVGGEARLGDFAARPLGTRQAAAGDVLRPSLGAGAGLGATRLGGAPEQGLPGPGLSGAAGADGTAHRPHRGRLSSSRFSTLSRPTCPGRVSHGDQLLSVMSAGLCGVGAVGIGAGESDVEQDAWAPQEEGAVPQGAKTGSSRPAGVGCPLRVHGHCLPLPTISPWAAHALQGRRRPRGLPRLSPHAAADGGWIRTAASWCPPRTCWECPPDRLPPVDAAEPLDVAARTHQRLSRRDALRRVPFRRGRAAHVDHHHTLRGLCRGGVRRTRLRFLAALLEPASHRRGVQAGGAAHCSVSPRALVVGSGADPAASRLARTGRGDDRRAPPYRRPDRASGAGGSLFSGRHAPGGRRGISKPSRPRPLSLPVLPLSAPATGGETAMNWGNPDTWDRFLEHASGKQYSFLAFSQTTDAALKQAAKLLGEEPGSRLVLLAPARPRSPSPRLGDRTLAAPPTLAYRRAGSRNARRS